MEQDDVAVTHLVEHADQMTFAKGSTLGGLHRRDIGNIAVITNGVVVNEIAYLLYQTIIANGDVAQRGVVDSWVLGKALGNLHLLFELTQADVAIEYHTVETIRSEGLVNHHTVPTFRPAAIVVEYGNFLLCQMSVFSHK